MIDRGIEAQLAAKIRDFLQTAGDAHYAAAFDLGDLANRRAYGTRRGGHGERLARFRLADVQEPNIGGHSRHAEHAKRG